MRRIPPPPFVAGDYFLKPFAYGFVFIGVLRTIFDEPHHGLVLCLVGLVLVVIVNSTASVR